MTTKNQTGRKSGDAPSQAQQYNCRFVDGQLIVERGTTEGGSFPVSISPIIALPPAVGRTRAVAKPVTIMINKRAPGMWAGIVGGPKAKTEHLAELAVKYDLVAALADVLSDAELMRRITDKLLRANQRFKEGVFTMDYPTLLRAVAGAIGATFAEAEAKSVAARIIAQLLARPFEKLNVMVPFVGAVEPTVDDEPIAPLSMIMFTERVSTVAEVFDAIDLGGAFAGAREFNPAVAESMISPLLRTAADRLQNSLRYAKYMRDTAIMTARYICNPSTLPEHMQDSADLAYLASNANFMFGCLQHVNDAILTPDFDLREAVSYTVTRLREMKRFETWTLDKFASHYGIELVRLETGYVAGAIVARNDGFRMTAPVTRYVDRGDIVTQLPSTLGEAYVSPYVEAINTAFGNGHLRTALSLAAQYAIVHTAEGADVGLTGAITDTSGFIFRVGVTPLEEKMLAVHYARHLTLGYTDAEDVSDPVVFYELVDNKLFYESQGLYAGGTITTSHPGEVLLLQGVDVDPRAEFPSRPQNLLDDARKLILHKIPTTFKVNGEDHVGAIEMDKDVRIVLPALDNTPVELSESLQKMLGLDEIGQLHIGVDYAARKYLSSSLAAIVAVYDGLKRGGEREQLLARQLAIATHQLIGKVAASATFKPLVRTVSQRLLFSPQFKDRRAAMRNHLQDAFTRHVVTVNAAFVVMLKTGVLHFGVHEDIVKMFAEQKVVEVAVLSGDWQAVMNMA